MAKEFHIKEKYDIEDLISIVALLRAPGGCPWDAEQTHQSIKKNFIHRWKKKRAVLPLTMWLTI